MAAPNQIENTESGSRQERERRRTSRWSHVGEPILRVVVCIAAVSVITAGLYLVPLRDRALAAALTFFLVVIVSSVRGLRYTLFVSFLAALGFTWLLPPVGRFWLSDPHDVFGLAAFLVIGMIASHLSGRARREAEKANQRRAEAVAAHQRFENLIETVPTMVFSIRPDGSSDFVSRNGQEYLGLSLEDISSGGWQATIHPDDREMHLGKWRRSMETGQPFENEVRHRSVNGEYRWFLVRVVPLRDEKGEILKWYGVMTDIEDRKRAEQSRQEIEEQWKAAFESNPTMYFIINEAREILSVNAYGAEQLGYTVGELIGQPVLSVFYEPDRRAVHDHASACFEQPGTMMRWEARKIRRDGTMLWVRETANAVFLKNRLVLLVVCEDITEQRLAEEAARRSERELRDAIENIPAMVFTALPGPSNVFASRGWREYTGLSSEDTAGSGWQTALHPEDTERFMEKWRVSSATGEPFEDEARIRRAADGEYQWFLVRAVALRDERGNILKWYGVLTDIEDRKRAEEALRHTATELRDLIETMPSLTFSTWPDGSSEFTTGRWREYSGLSTEETFGERGASTIHPNDRDQHLSKWRASLASGEPFENEARHRSAKGEYRWFLVRAVPLRNEHGSILKWFGVLTDIEDRKRAEETLRRSEAYLSEAQKLAHTGSFALDPNTLEPRYLSDEVIRMWGYNPEVGLPTRSQLLDRFHSEDREKAIEVTSKCRLNKTDAEDEFRIVLPDGRLKHIHRVIHAVLNATGEVVELIGTNVDVTERKQSEEALRRSETYLAEAQRLTKTGSLAWDPDNARTLHCSDEIYRMFGLDPQKGMPALAELLERVHPEDREYVTGRSRKGADGKAKLVVDYRLLLAHGELKYIHSIRHPILNDPGEVIEFLGTLVDVTERKQAEEDLRAAETRFRTYVDHATDVLFVHDEQSRIVDMNRQACESLGYTREELMGASSSLFDPGVDETSIQRIRERLEARDLVTFESSCRRKDGTIFPVEVRISPFLYGGHRYGLSLARDISERKRAEQERERLRQMEEDLARINRVSMMGELTASLAHEIKQPIAAAVSNAEACLEWLAREEPDLAEVREAATEMVNEARRAAEIITRVRSLFKKEDTKREVLDLNEVINGTVILIGEEANRGAILLRTELAEELPRILADRVQLQQVLINLMLNGLEAMNGSGGELIIRSQRDQEGRPLISVSDAGMGLPAGAADKIFDAFFTTKSQGTGMGLAISRSIIESHGGRLWASSNAGPGATLYFSLPIHR